MTTALIVPAATCVMADGRRRPHIVHGPDNGFAGIKYPADALQRDIALVYPCEVYDVGLLEVPCLRYVYARIGGVYLEEMLPFQMQVEEDAQPLPKERPLRAPRASHRCYRYLVGLLVAHQHSCFHTVVVECVHQAV